MNPLLAALTLAVAVLLSSLPAEAHGLRLFVRTEGGQVSGYGFFLGGGRPKGVEWRATLDGVALAEGVTDTEGGFGFALPAGAAGQVVVILDTGDGHMAQKLIAVGGGAGAIAPGAIAPAPGVPAPATEAPPDLAVIVAQAVAQEVAPLSEQITALEARLRLVDLIAGLCLIAGLGGVALWLRGRR